MGLFHKQKVAITAETPASELFRPMHDVPITGLFVVFGAVAFASFVIIRTNEKDTSDNPHGIPPLTNPVRFEGSIATMASIRCPLDHTDVIIDWVATKNGVDLASLKAGDLVIWPDCAQPSDTTLPG